MLYSYESIDNVYQAGNHAKRDFISIREQESFDDPLRDDRNKRAKVSTVNTVSESPPFPFTISSGPALPDNNFQYSYPQDFNYFYYYSQPNQPPILPVNYYTPPPVQVFPPGLYTSIPAMHGLQVNNPVQNVNMPQNIQSLSNPDSPPAAKPKTPPPPPQKKKLRARAKNKAKKQTESESTPKSVPEINTPQFAKENEPTFMQYIAQHFTALQIKIFQLQHQQRTENINK